MERQNLNPELSDSKACLTNHWTTLSSEALSLGHISLLQKYTSSKNCTLVCVCVCLRAKSLHSGMLSHFSCVRLFATPWTVAWQPPLSMGFSRQEYWNGLPCPPLGDLPDPGVELTSLTSPAVVGGFFITGDTWETLTLVCITCFFSLLTTFPPHN